MKAKTKKYIALYLVALVVFFWCSIQGRAYRNAIKQDIRQMQQELNQSGMPPEEVRALGKVFTRTSKKTAVHVDNSVFVFLMLILFLGQIVISYSDKD